jgi:hypothetical protein
MPEQVTPAQALGGAYPVEAPKIDTSALEAQIKELQEQNKTLLDKVKQAESEKLRQLAGQVADLKIGKKMLTKGKRDDEISKLSKLSEETLRTLADELSQIPVTLTEAPEAPAPIAPPVSAPVQLSDEQKKDQEMKQIRLSLFGHEQPADEFYREQAIKLNSKRSL